LVIYLFIILSSATRTKTHPSCECHPPQSLLYSAPMSQSLPDSQRECGPGLVCGKFNVW